MPYRVSRDPDLVPRITLEGEPACCHPLAAGVPGREPELDRGLWLVLAFAVWSVPDVAAVQDALEVARRHGGGLELGLRPYDDPLELQAWWPGANPYAPGPFWVLLRDGEVLRHRAGRPGAEELERWIHSGADDAAPPPATRPHDV